MEEGEEEESSELSCNANALISSAPPRKPFHVGKKKAAKDEEAILQRMEVVRRRRLLTDAATEGRTFSRPRRVL